MKCVSFLSTHHRWNITQYLYTIYMLISRTYVPGLWGFPSKNYLNLLNSLINYSYFWFLKCSFLDVVLIFFNCNTSKIFKLHQLYTQYFKFWFGGIISAILSFFCQQNFFNIDYVIIYFFRYDTDMLLNKHYLKQILKLKKYYLFLLMSA